MADTRAARTWNRIAPGYDRLLRSFLVPCYHLMLEAITPQPGDTLLDIGCGTGELEVLLCAKHGTDLTLTGIDPAPKMIDLAQQKFTETPCDVALRAGLFTPELVADRGPFDWVISNNILHWLSDPAADVAAWARVLKPGGQMVNLTLDAAIPWQRWGVPLLRLFTPGFGDLHTAEEVRALHTAAELVEIEIERKRVSGFYGVLIARARKSDDH